MTRIRWMPAYVLDDATARTVIYTRDSTDGPRRRQFYQRHVSAAGIARRRIRRV